MEIDPAHPPPPAKKDWFAERAVGKPWNRHIGAVLPAGDLWDKDGLPVLDVLMEHFRVEGKLANADCIKLLNKAEVIMRQEPNLLKIDDPVTIVGDIHGQYYDMHKMFRITGHPQHHQYLFLGDYVDRGHWGCEVMLYLCACKVRYPSQFYLLRGNHETQSQNEHAGFQKECDAKYPNIYKYFMQMMQTLPIAAIVGGSFFCVHAGLSKNLMNVDDLDKEDRDKPDFKPGTMIGDLIWSDPFDDKDHPAAVPERDFVPNGRRGVMYTARYSLKFLRANKLLCVIRGHSETHEGYKFHQCLPERKNFPCVVTVFSAPDYTANYYQQYDDTTKAAVIRVQNRVINIRQFDALGRSHEESHGRPATHVGNHDNILLISLPYIHRNVTDLLKELWSEASKGSGNADGADSILVKGMSIKERILAMGRVSQALQEAYAQQAKQEEEARNHDAPYL